MRTDADAVGSCQRLTRVGKRKASRFFYENSSHLYTSLLTTRLQRSVNDVASRSVTRTCCGLGSSVLQQFAQLGVSFRAHLNKVYCAYTFQLKQSFAALMTSFAANCGVRFIFKQQ